MGGVPRTLEKLQASSVQGDEDSYWVRVMALLGMIPGNLLSVYCIFFLKTKKPYAASQHGSYRNAKGITDLLNFQTVYT